MKIILLQVIALVSFALVSNGQSHGSVCNTSEDCNSTENLVCLSKNCECVRGFTVDRNKVCRKTYDEPCERILDCNIDKHLTCAPGANLCKCQIPEEQIFDIGTRKACVSLVGHRCDMVMSHDERDAGEFALNCVTGAFCEMRHEDGSMVHDCQCSEGWEATADLTCRRTQ